MKPIRLSLSPSDHANLRSLREDEVAKIHFIYLCELYGIKVYYPGVFLDETGAPLGCKLNFGTV